MIAQRRYSVTGQTPADDAEAMKAGSGQPQVLDTDAPTSKLGLAGSEHNGSLRQRGRNMGQTGGAALPSSSKRSATQLPSPNSPSYHPPPPPAAAAAQVARFRVSREHREDVDADQELDSDSSTGSEADDDDDDHGDDIDTALESPDTSFSSTPRRPQRSRECSPPEVSGLEQLRLWTEVEAEEEQEQEEKEEEEEEAEDECMEDLALSPPRSRDHSSERQHARSAWPTFHPSAPTPTPTSVGSLAPLEPEVSCSEAPAAPPLTFLTLPPEIRHQIYRHCRNLVIDKPLLYCISTFDSELQHPLASVSRQVRYESLSIFYSHNVWAIKVEFRIMYEAFQDWIIRLGPGAALLRLVTFSVRGSLFRPRRRASQQQNAPLPGQPLPTPTAGTTAPGPAEDLYCPPDGDASFHIDLSERHVGGRVQLVRNDGCAEAGEQATRCLGKMVEDLWARRRAGTLNGQDWVTMVDNFITLIGGW